MSVTYPTPGSSTYITPKKPVTEEMLLNFVGARRQDSISHHQAFFSQVARWYDMYRGIYAGKFAAFRNSIHLPILFSVVWSDIAKKVQLSLGYPPVSFTGYGDPQEEAVARRNEVLIGAQFRKARIFDKSIDFLGSANLYGTGVARTGWSHISQRHKWRERQMGKEITRTGRITTFDGPDLEVIDILDYWPQPGIRTIQDAAWGIHRYYTDYDTILSEQASAEAEGYTPPYDKASVARLGRLGMGTPTEDSYRQRVSVYRTYSEHEARRKESYAKPVEITEYWGQVPSELAKDGYTNLVITVANSTVVLRVDCNPFWHMQKPFIKYCPCPDLHSFHGTGKVEVGMKMAAAANRIINQKLDALDRFIDPMFLADTDTGLAGQSIYTRPGKIIPVNGPVTEDRIRALIPDLRGVSVAFQELEVLSKFIQQGTGIIEDTVQGIAGARTTAREYLGRSESSMSRLGLEALIFETQFIEVVAEHFRMNNRQFLPIPYMVKSLGSAMVTDPVTGMPLPLQSVNIDLSDLNADFGVRALGASRMLGKSMRVQNLAMAIQTAQSNPVGMQITNWANMLREFYGALELDVSAMLVSQVPGVNQMAQQQGMTPEQVIGQQMGGQQSGTNLEQLDPQQLQVQPQGPMTNLS